MSTQLMNPSAPMGAITLFRVVDAIDHAFHAVVAWRRARATRLALSALSNDQLQDIGLERAEIADLATAIRRG